MLPCRPTISLVAPVCAAQTKSYYPQFVQIGAAQNYTSTAAPFSTTPAPVVSDFKVKFSVTFDTLSKADFTPAKEISYKQAVISLIPGYNQTDYNRVSVAVSDARRRSAGSARRLLAAGIKVSNIGIGCAVCPTVFFFRENITVLFCFGSYGTSGRDHHQFG